jgi:hypothetical protein
MVLDGEHDRDGDQESSDDAEAAASHTLLPSSWVRQRPDAATSRFIARALPPSQGFPSQERMPGGNRLDVRWARA